MTKVSLAIIVGLLILGIAINMQQGGAATTATKLGYAPLAAYLAVAGIS
jgi:hypothetical protein